MTTLKYLPRFFKKMYQVSPAMFLANLFTRLIKAFMPVATLWVGKEIIDQIVLLIGNSGGDTTLLYQYVAIEF